MHSNTTLAIPTEDTESEFLSPDRTVISQFNTHCHPNRGIIKGSSVFFRLFDEKVKKFAFDLLEWFRELLYNLTYYIMIK